jgi:hypothetical protein
VFSPIAERPHQFDRRQLGGPRGECVHRDLDAGCQRATDELAPAEPANSAYWAAELNATQARS